MDITEKYYEENLRQFKVVIEATAVKEFNIIAEDAERALEIAAHNYRSGKFVVDTEKAQFNQMAIVSPDNEVTEWIEF